MGAFQGNPAIPEAGCCTDEGVAEAAVAPLHQVPPREPRRRPPGHPPQGLRLILFVLLPFAAGFHLSYLFRTINALILGQLVNEFALGAADLGLLTSVYFLTFAAAQLPVGVLLDRYGPRRVQSALLLVAAGGATAFAVSAGLPLLIIGRGLIGLGVAAALMASLKAIVLWCPKERVPLANGWMVMFGALGAVTATAPVELLLAWIGWRELFALLAVATAACAIVIYLVVPERASAVPAAKAHGPVTLKAIYADPRFWRLAPVSATCAGTAWALQGLWAVPWLADVEGLDRPAIVRQLFIMAMALSAGALLVGMAADRLSRRGVGPRPLLGFVAALLIAAQLALILRWPLPSSLLWAVVAAAGAAPVLGYAVLAEYFPEQAAGRANGALNVFHLGWAFILQYAIGLLLQQWWSRDGHYPAIAYRVAFALVLAPQIAALGSFALPWLATLASRLARGALARSPGASATLKPITPYEKTRPAWRPLAAQAQADRWRLAARGSASLAIALGLALAISPGRATVRHMWFSSSGWPRPGSCCAGRRTIGCADHIFLRRFRQERPHSLVARQQAVTHAQSQPRKDWREENGQTHDDCRRNAGADHRLGVGTASLAEWRQDAFARRSHPIDRDLERRDARR